MGRFALASLLAFVAIGAAVTVLSNGQIVRTQERDAQFHAEFVADSLLAHKLPAYGLKSPFRGRRYRSLNRFVTTRILEFPVRRIKIWRLDGTILYSDEPRLVGVRFPREPDSEVRHGKVLSDVTDLSERENRFERGLEKVTAEYSLRADGGLTVVNRGYDPKKDRWREATGKAYFVGPPTQMKSDFAAVASHEMRTPLTAILGYVKTLRQPEFENDPKARSEFMAAIDRQAERLFRLVTNLLTAAQVEKREDHAHIASFDVRALVEEVAEGFHEGGARIRLSVPESLPMLVTDRVRVSEILTNLIDNALKYSADEAPVDVGASTSPSGENVTFWVQDCGVGIEPADLNRIFERFYQTDQSSTRRFGGVGLGLHLVAELAASLGGRVEVESVPGVGSTFTVTLPVG